MPFFDALILLILSFKGLKKPYRFLYWPRGHSLLQPFKRSKIIGTRIRTLNGLEQRATRELADPERGWTRSSDSKSGCVPIPGEREFHGLRVCSSSYRPWNGVWIDSRRKRGAEPRFWIVVERHLTTTRNKKRREESPQNPVAMGWLRGHGLQRSVGHATCRRRDHKFPSGQPDSRMMMIIVIGWRMMTMISAMGELSIESSWKNVWMERVVDLFGFGTENEEDSKTGWLTQRFGGILGTNERVKDKNRVLGLHSYSYITKVNGAD